MLFHLETADGLSVDLRRWQEVGLASFLPDHLQPLLLSFRQLGLTVDQLESVVLSVPLPLLVFVEVRARRDDLLLHGLGRERVLPLKGRFLQGFCMQLISAEGLVDGAVTLDAEGRRFLLQSLFLPEGIQVGVLPLFAILGWRDDLH